MYTIIFIVLFGLGAVLLIGGLRNQIKGRIILGAFLVAFTPLFYWFMDFWGEMLWFQSVGYGQRFWIVELSQIAMAVTSFLITGLLVLFILKNVPKNFNGGKYIAVGLSAFIGGVWGYTNWELILKFWYGTSTEVLDPILAKNTGFYLFDLPFYNSITGVFTSIFIIALIASLLPILIKPGKEPSFRQVEGFEFLSAKTYKPFYVSFALLLLVMAISQYLNRYNLMYSDWGAVSGPGWTDVNIRLPAYTIISIVIAIFAIGTLLPGFRHSFKKLIWRIKIMANPAPPFVILTMALVLGAIWFLALVAAPGLFQTLAVVPNEITYERQYIANNIEFTRKAFKLDQVQERQFAASDTFNQQMVKNNSQIFNNIRLWDYRALDEVYKQFQEIRLYYEFHDVDIDRYTFGNQYREVMISAREMETSNLPAQSQTFVNKRFKYTHGFGLTMATVNEFTNQGLPNLIIKNIPPISSYPEIEVTEPRIYYGELTDDHAVVNSEEEEFDYPEGDENKYIRYPGTGGVQISNLWRKFLFGYKFDGTKFFLSNYTRENSRIMFHRDISERVRILAPFLKFDDDPYVVLADGGIKFMVDAYTTSTYFPYSEPYDARERLDQSGSGSSFTYNVTQPKFQGDNYLRNSVKVVIDAYNGKVDFYVFEPEDPLIQVWDKIFPGMFKSRQEMPETMENHIRYPADMLLTQGIIYAKYHMTDPTVFYNQEDVWIRATEKYYSEIQPVEPYYIMWEPEKNDKPDFIVMLPFTPKNRQVLIGWIAGMCDPENYGTFISYQFPKDKRVLGPQQVETKIDQDSFLSGQLTLWDQRGSNVIRGNVLAIPVENTIIYVEPIYLQAETAAYPELRLVAVMHKDNLSYAESFDEALQGLFGKEIPIAKKAETTDDEAPDQREEVADQDVKALITSANQAFEDYLRYTGNKEFQNASKALDRLENLLQQLSKEEKSTKNTFDSIQ